MIRLGDATVPYNSDFRLYMTSTLPNPHYAPEAQVRSRGGGCLRCAVWRCTPRVLSNSTGGR